MDHNFFIGLHFGAHVFRREKIMVLDILIDLDNPEDVDYVSGRVLSQSVAAVEIEVNLI